MFDRFSDDAKRAMSRSRQEALRLRHDCISVEHILLALLRTPDESVATIVQRAGGDAARVVQALDAVIAPGHGGDMGQLPFTPAGKQALMLTMEAANGFGHGVIDTAHLLLGAVGAAAGERAEAALAAGGLRLAELKRACAATALAESELDDGPATVRRSEARAFDLGDVVATVADFQLRLGAFAGAAEEQQQSAAAAVLRALVQHCVQARAALVGSG
jgi:ATP-dependent Clp protease ATP-binding subunit ClpA